MFSGLAYALLTKNRGLCRVSLSMNHYEKIWFIKDF